MITLKAMQTFVETVEAGSLAGAARSLAVGPSAVSKQIASLEEALGVRLLQRTTRSIALTNEGEYFFEECQRLLAEVAEARDTVAALADKTTGTLRVAAPPTFGQLWLAPVISEFRALHPDLDIQVWLSDDDVDLIHDGFDIAIRDGELPDSSLMARRLAEGRYAVCAAPSYLKAHGTPKTPRELLDHDCITSIRFPPLKYWEFRSPDGQKEILPVRGTLSTNSYALMLDAALNGQGICRLPLFAVARHLRTGRLQSLFTAQIPSIGGIWAVYPTRNHLPRRVQVFLDFLSERAVHWPESLRNDSSSH